jgi:O-acetyl-ADP-ribose deacetylase (regulator of RNase III)
MSIFESPAEALVNPVNCKGVSGAGLAKEFKERFPKNYHSYRKFCLENQLYMGVVHSFFDSKLIFNFPTKNHWESSSSIIWIKKGLVSLRDKVEFMGIQSIAIPALGCGLGKLRYHEVRKEILKAFSKINTTLYLYNTNKTLEICDPLFLSSPTRTVYGIENGNPFVICDVKGGETDHQAVIRAADFWRQKVEFRIMTEQELVDNYM